MGALSRSTGIYAALAMTAALAGCNGKPEDTGQSSGAPAPAAPVKGPAPAYADWVAPMLGHKVTEFAKVTTPCLGSFDVAGTRYVGPPAKVDVAGWGWDQTGKRPIARVVLTNEDGRIVGGAVTGVNRPDVPAAVPEVKTPAVGWKGIAQASSGDITAVGLTASGGFCTLGTTTL